VAAVYQRHDFLLERKEALDRWAAHVESIVRTVGQQNKHQPSPDTASDRVGVAIQSYVDPDVRFGAHREP
jgi:hypothetical protein